MQTITQKITVPKKARIWILLALCAGVALLWLANWYLLSRFITDQAARGQFGDMFGAVNALFTALAFAGLIYTVLLQRDQLAIQQQEIVESGKTQKELVQQQIEAQNELSERQKAFQEEQRQKRVEHELKLEQLRQDFHELAEKRQKDRETESKAEFERNVLRAIRRELEVLGTIYDKGIGAKFANLADGQIFTWRLALTEDWFTVFKANATHLGRIESGIAQRIVAIYLLMKGLIEEFRINNGYLLDLDQINAALGGNPSSPPPAPAASPPIGEKRIRMFTPSLLARAFAGKLVPQDPNDKPASVLLERIRAFKGEL